MSGSPYSEQVRRDAITRVLDFHIPVVQVAREVGCSIDTMHRWLRPHRQQGSARNRQQDTVPKYRQGTARNRRQDVLPNHQQGATQPSVNKTLHLPLPKDAPSVNVRKNRHTKTPSTTPPSRATFVPVNIIDARDHFVEIVVPGGITLRLTDVSPQYIAELLNALATC
jgi:transposase-like protein